MEPKDNDLKISMTIEMEQGDSEGKLSTYKSSEYLHYPTLTNTQANMISMDLNEVVKKAASEYIRGLSLAKAEERSEIIKEEDYRGKGVIR